MASAGSIFVDLLLRDSQYQSGWNKVRNTTKQGSRQVQGDVKQIGTAFNSTINPVNNLGNAVKNLAGIFAGALSVQKVIQYSDSWKQLSGRLAIVQGEFGDLAKTQQDLFDVAQRTRQPLDGILSFYSRLAQFIPEAERAQYDLLGVTESVSAALAITGETSASATAAMIQFTQAIGTNFEAAGQELRSLQEQAPRLTQALMKALGDGTKSLQQLKEEGKLTRESVLNALSGAGEEGRKLAEELAKVPLTVSQAFQRLDNAFLKFIGQSSEVTKGATSLALGISKLAENLDLVARAVIVLGGAILAKGLASFIAFSIEQVRVNRQMAITSATAIAQAAAFDKLSASMVTNSRLTAALAKQQAAAAGTIGSSTIIVNRVGDAAVVSAGRVGILSRAVGALGIAFRGLIGLLGGPIGALATLGVVVYTFSEDILEFADKITFFGKSVGDILRDIGEGAKIIFSEMKTIITDAFSSVATVVNQVFSGVLESLNGLINASKIRLFEFIQVLNRIPGVNIGDEFVLNSLAKPGAFESGMRSIADNYRIGVQKALADAQRQVETNSSGITSSNLPQTQQSLGGGTVGGDNKALKELDTLLKQHRALIMGIDTQTLRYIETEKELEKLFKAQRISVDEYYTALETLDKQYETTSEKAQKFGLDIDEFGKQAARNLQDAFADFLFDPFEKGLRGMLAGFVDTLRRMAAEAAAQNILSGIFGKDGLGSFGTIFGAIGQGLAGARASGGHVQAGKSYLVGERGMEVFTPTVSGTIIPNNALSGGENNGKGNVYNIDARGADQGAVARVEQALLALAGPGVIERRVSNAQVRGAL